jgi:DNA-binding NarL/FixJ family response regulator
VTAQDLEFVGGEFRAHRLRENANGHLLQRGRNPASFAKRLARVAVLRVLSGRLSSSPDSSSDVLSRLAKQQHGFAVESLSTAPATNSDWESVLVENHKVTPADVAISRIDFSEWLGRMKQRRREIAETLAAGYDTSEVAERFQLSPARVSQMRREFENSWCAFQRNAGEEQIAAA